MPDTKKKLDALAEQHGLIRGSDIVREAEHRTPPPPRDTSTPEAAETVTERRETLRSLTERLDLMTGTDYARKHEELDKQRQDGDFEIHNVVPGELHGEDGTQFFLARTDYPLDYHQGIIELGAALQSKSEHIAFSAADTELLNFDPRRTLFMDTETTGLAGGTGTVAFLVGAGYFIGDCFRLDQCFMRDFDDEEPMLHYLAGLFDSFDTIVGYNSKSFDLPLLRTRFVQNRIPFRLETSLHYDLVHAARRFWKRRLADCSLGNIERQVLGIHRHGDVPSYLIPEMWFDYLNSRDARPLEGVFYHHRMDILSLVSLTAWVSRSLDESGEHDFEHAEDRLSLVRMHFLQKHYDEVIRHGALFLEAHETSPLRRECLEMLGLAHKRRQGFTEMQQTLELLLDEFPSDIHARIELAKHYEHRTRNLLEAERLCRQAARHTGEAPGAHELAHRLERIQRKLAKGRAPGTDDPDID